MDDLLELVMDVLLEGAAETAASPKAPLRVRIILILILGIGFFGVAGLIFWVGLDTGKWGLMLLGLALLTGGGAWIWYKYREYQRRRKKSGQEIVKTC